MSDISRIINLDQLNTGHTQGTKEIGVKPLPAEFSRRLILSDTEKAQQQLKDSGYFKPHDITDVLRSTNENRVLASRLLNVARETNRNFDRRFRNTSYANARFELGFRHSHNDRNTGVYDIGIYVQDTGRRKVFVSFGTVRKNRIFSEGVSFYNNYRNGGLRVPADSSIRIEDSDRERLEGLYQFFLEGQNYHIEEKNGFYHKD